MNIFQKISAVGGAILAVAILIMAIAVALAAWNFGKAVTKAIEFLHSAQVDLAPVIRNVTVISEDVRDISNRAKDKARKVEETVDNANALVNKAIRKTDNQVQKIQSFVGFVQDKIESTFVSAASTVRGVQTGLETMVDSLDEELEQSDSDSNFKNKSEPRVRTRQEKKYE